MRDSASPGKAKIARRVIEVLEFFAQGHEQAIVMDIVRQYKRPQSSTSELLGALVNEGLLYKNVRTRAYSPTPRMMALGCGGQTRLVADGRLFALMDNLAQTSRCGVGLFGVVGTDAQIFRWASGREMSDPRFTCGAKTALSSGAVGQLLLAGLGMDQANRILWRLHAETEKSERFNLSDLTRTVSRIGASGHASGPSGFAKGTRATAMLLRGDAGDRPLVLGVVYRDQARVDAEALVAALQNGIAEILRPDHTNKTPVGPNLIAV